MKAVAGKTLEESRVMHPTRGASPKGSLEGFFIMHLSRGDQLRMLSSCEDGWDRVAVSVVTRSGKVRPPSWKEMMIARNLFFELDESPVQYALPKSRFRNDKPHWLNWWRPQHVRIPLPPVELATCRS